MGRRHISAISRPYLGHILAISRPYLPGLSRGWDGVDPNTRNDSLAAAPDPGVRDGQQALNLAENLLEETPGLALGETIAMALAELGRFGDATQMQRDVMTVAQQAGIDRTVILRMNDNLLLYENGRASRRPFRIDEMP